MLADTWSQDWSCIMPVPRQYRHCFFFTTGVVLCRLQILAWIRLFRLGARENLLPTSYRRRDCSTGIIPDIGTMLALKSVLYQYWQYSEVTDVSRHLVSGLELYYASTAPVQALFLLYNWRGTVPFANTGMNPTFPPGIRNQHCNF